MDTFRWIAVVLSTVLGLGIARILSGYVAAFKMRAKVGYDWLPALLSAVVLSEILQFWWAIAELGTRPNWTLADFTVLIALVMLLFLSAALIAPTEGDLDQRRDYFEHDGRWALLVLACYHLAAIVANARFWDAPLLGLSALLTLALAAISGAAALITRRPVQQILAIAYCLLAVMATLVDSPSAY
jgi:hypothetical protein